MPTACHPRLRVLQKHMLETRSRMQGLNMSTTLQSLEGMSAAEVEEATFRIEAVEAFSYDPPTIRVFHPTHAPTAGGTTVNIRGSNFGTRSQVC